MRDVSPSFLIKVWALGHLVAFALPSLPPPPQKKREGGSINSSFLAPWSPWRERLGTSISHSLNIFARPCKKLLVHMEYTTKYSTVRVRTKYRIRPANSIFGVDEF